MTRQTENNRVDKTLRKLSLDKEAPKSAFILLLLLYAISSALTVAVARNPGTINLFGLPIEYTSLTGVFSLLSNICVICLTVLFRKKGYFVSLFLLLSSVPAMYVNVFIRQNYRNLPGFFNCLMAIIAITIIFLTNRKIVKYQNTLREQAVTDRLTGLPNRFACSELMSDLLRRNEAFALVSIDLNDFKSINDTMGHDTGDLVLQEVARRWKDLANSQKTGTTDFIARSTGDEFMLVVSGYKSEDSIEKTIAIYRSNIEKKITIDDCDYYMTACFGYALCPEDSDVLDNLFTFSDAVLHEIKKKGTGSRIMRFVPEVFNTEKELEIERKIRAALNENKFFYHLQPQFDINHKLRGFEALARMKDDNGNFISPVEFIPVAEKTGLVDRIDMCVFEQAVQFLREATKEAGNEVLLSVNVSVRHLMKNNFIEDDDLDQAITDIGSGEEL